jgi:electron transfer flavoprotein beta subunit
MGGDRGIRIDTEGRVLDSFLTAKILAGVIKEEKFDLVFSGKQAVDDDCTQVPQATAELLGWPEVSVIEKFEVSQGKATVQRPFGGGIKEILEVELPAIFGCEKDLNKPRYASLPGIMKAKGKPIDERSAKDFIGDEGPRLEILKYRLPPERKAGRKLEGEPEELAEALVKYLKEEIRVIA